MHQADDSRKMIHSSNVHVKSYLISETPTGEQSRPRRLSIKIRHASFTTRPPSCGDGGGVLVRPAGTVHNPAAAPDAHGDDP